MKIHFSTGEPDGRTVYHNDDVLGFADTGELADLFVAALTSYMGVIDTGKSGTEPDPVYYRVGRSLGRTVYRQVGSDPSKGDELIGIMDTREGGSLVVAALNHYHQPNHT